MTIVQVHNAYGRPSGEETVVENLVGMLERRGHVVLQFGRSSETIPRMRWGGVRAFFSGIYNPFTRREFGRFLAEHRPELVHVHNVFPLISPSVLVEARRRQVPVVMTLHNYRLLCPSGLLMRNGRPCHECLGGHEFRCVIHNCERSRARSVGYALRTGIARRQRYFLNGVREFVCLTRFQRDLHVAEGFPDGRCSVIPNAMPARLLDRTDGEPESASGSGGFVGFVGRISPEKDVDTLFEAARGLPHIPFRMAGSTARMPGVRERVPSNVELAGHLDGDALQQFYDGMRLLVFPTRCYEGLPMVLLEAMAAGLPVVCARIGGLPEVVEDSVTGLLFTPGDPADLGSKVAALWENKELSKQLGRAGRSKVVHSYHPDRVYEKLMAVYGRAKR